MEDGITSVTELLCMRSRRTGESCSLFTFGMNTGRNIRAPFGVTLPQQRFYGGRCGCPELRPKGTICFWEGFKEWCEGRGYDPCTVGIATRYELYNAYFYEINNRK